MDNEQIRQARVELARRELARRTEAAAQTQALPPTPLQVENPGFLDMASRAADRVTATIPAAASIVNPSLGLMQYAGQQMNEASGKLGLAVTEKVAEEFPNAPTAVPVGLGVVSSVVSNPTTYAVPEVGYSSKLAPFKGKPGLAARIKQMRTGVEASAFEQLRRDPGAFIQTIARDKAGAAIGKAKESAGINLGITDDVASLTPDNIAKARNLQGTANRMQDVVIDKVQKSQLPVVQPGAKTGAPHAVYAYSDDFGPGGTSRDIYNVFGDPENSVVKQRGWGSSVPKSELEKLGIPVVGREPRAEQFLKVTPNEVSTALEGINKRLSKIERTEGRGSPSFQQWSVIKGHFQNMLEDVAPDVRAANQAFSRVALRDKFMEPFPVNQSGTMSKIDAFGFTPAAVAGGGALGGPIGAAAAYVAKTAARSPFVAGAGTALRGGLDKLIDPSISAAVNVGSRGSGSFGSFASDPDSRRKSFIQEYLNRVTVGKQ